MISMIIPRVMPQTIPRLLPSVERQRWEAHPWTVRFLQDASVSNDLQRPLSNHARVRCQQRRVPHTPLGPVIDLYDENGPVRAISPAIWISGH